MMRPGKKEGTIEFMYTWELGYQKKLLFSYILLYLKVKIEEKTSTISKTGVPKSLLNKMFVNWASITGHPVQT